MPLKPLNQHGPTVVPGFSFSGIHSGIKRNKDSLDLGLIHVTSPNPANIAGVFTTNSIKAAPVVLNMNKISKHKGRAIIVNSGNANACTGIQGSEDAVTMCETTAKFLDCPSDEVFVCSTGVIGQHLPMEKIKSAIPSLIEQSNEKNFLNTAKSILTTDTFEKYYSKEIQLNGHKITFLGFAKGAGMIQPDMATMLAFIMCDALVPQDILQKALRDACEQTFNCITVDGEMSTNDSVLLMANGMAANPEFKPGSEFYEKFYQGLFDCCDFLSKQIVRDGEGCNKFVELLISGIDNPNHLKAVSYAIANSYLVKTAFHGEDPNWGRILSAAGAQAARMGFEINKNQTSIYFNDFGVFIKGQPQGEEAEQKAKKAMKNSEFYLKVMFGPNPTKKVKLYTTDLTPDYIRINANYRS